MLKKAFISTLTTLILVSSGTAWAQGQGGSLGGMFKQTQTSFTGVGNLILGGSFLSGIFISATGLMKLKAAADSQGRDPHYSDGLIRLAVGAALCSLPAIIGVMTGTLGVSGGSKW